jgi:hypothetical protein
VRNHSLFYCLKFVDKTKYLLYNIIKLRENKHTGGKQNEKFNEDGNKSIQ